jgi:uncharacterized protein
MKRIFLILLITVILTSCITSKFEIVKDKIEIKNKNYVKILQISDLHMKKKKVIYDDVISKINEIKPDLLFITGDSIEYDKDLDLLDSYLSQIDSSIKKYAILGNREYRYKVSLEKLKNVYEKNGIKLLINQTDKIQIGDLNFYIIGFDDFLFGNINEELLKTIDNSDLNLIMVHCPEFFDTIKNEVSDKNKVLVFSGHTHGGQITFFGAPLYLPKGSGKYLKGKYQSGNKTLYVSKGIGNISIDFRFFAKEDIVLIEIN